MPRIRSLHPSFWQDDKVADLPLGARLLFQGLWTYADDEGRLKENVRQLKAQVFPYDPFTSQEIGGWLQKIIDLGMVIHYNVDGANYLQIIHFRDYQHPDRPKPSRLPPPSAQESPRLVNDVATTGSCPVNAGVGGRKGKGIGKGMGEEVGVVETTPLPYADHQPPQEQSKTSTVVSAVDAAEVECSCLKVLRGIARWPFDTSKDLGYLRQLAVEFPSVDIAGELPQFAAYQLDHPIRNKGSPRLRLRHWMEKAAQFGVERRQSGRTRGGAGRQVAERGGDPFEGLTVIRSRTGKGAEEDTS